MFDKVYIEKRLKDHPRTLSILEKIKCQSTYYISRYDEVWGKVKKPYLQKRESLNLFIAEKKGELVKETPPAYGHGDEKHYFYIHAFNCIYECQYCYLQGYFQTPDIVLFINHEEIISEMQKLVELPENSNAWFHAGEYSDSLALAHITDELSVYFDFFKNNPKAKLELRSKAVNIRPLLQLEALPNVFVSFTLSSHESGKKFDTTCPSVKHRLNAIKKLVDHGYRIGLHFDPIIYEDNFQTAYKDILTEINKILPDEQLGYISLGVVRFTKDVYHSVKKHYPDSPFLKQDLIKSFDGKLRYNRPMRNWILNTVKDLCIQVGQYQEKKIYFCMED
ncbi:MAG: hypothetical protein CME62_04285 [Halobacteriovoraceae bacterium]|nr:hypothetical protein [Halobacteriovoraceae bacterium]